ncbi:sensor histidine kinase [Desulfovibrio inopinatus]|uniref:sensor histidine kinase n=1 Tax=Desulfovibrio inopinatus TaxID=102109 RepID=UPI00040F8B93|nr:HAMP domain-containing sensor histidine kinase [Desulfovibrio inopinatus]
MATLPTKFAPAERAGAPAIQQENEKLQADACLASMNAIPMVVLVLNAQRQLVFANDAFLKLLGATDIKPFLGKRPGEVFGCVYAQQNDGGCGTTEFCRKCGAVRSILSALGGIASVQECSMLRDHDADALELLVSSSPFIVEGENYVIFTITDISHEKRRRALERIFFHDILNTAGGARGLIDFLRDQVPDELRDDTELVHATLSQLVDEIVSQKELLAAESRELSVDPMTLRSLEVVRLVAATYAGYFVAEDKRISVDEASCDLELVTDYTLIRRILGNMVKNALEASVPEDTVTLGCFAEDDNIVFWVRNRLVMSEDVRLQVFKRSFSTKGAGRGLGTYSIKLLGERYLGGEVWFTSSEEAGGTTFYIRLPKRYRDPAELAD